MQIRASTELWSRAGLRQKNEGKNQSRTPARMNSRPEMRLNHIWRLGLSILEIPRSEYHPGFFASNHFLCDACQSPGQNQIHHLPTAVPISNRNRRPNNAANQKG